MGTDDARVLVMGTNGSLEALEGFDQAPGRETWYAGSAVVNGQVVGPPLGVRSMSANADGSVLLANVHVGGILRSTDGGHTWTQTIDIHFDVHEVCCHPTNPQVAVAATGCGLCVSRDAGLSWQLETEELFAPYCSAVALSGELVFVSCSTDHFAAEGRVHRRPAASLPFTTKGIVDTRNIFCKGPLVALADQGGNVYRSEDGGLNWVRIAGGLPAPSSIVIL